MFQFFGSQKWTIPNFVECVNNVWLFFFFTFHYIKAKFIIILSCILLSFHFLRCDSFIKLAKPAKVTNIKRIYPFFRHKLFHCFILFAVVLWGSRFPLSLNKIEIGIICIDSEKIFPWNINIPYWISCKIGVWQIGIY